MNRFGLKIWSTNSWYRDEAVRLFADGVYSFIELFVVPDSFNEFSHLWESLSIPFLVHAPHFDFGVNLAQRVCLARNRLRIDETLRFADLLKAPWVVVHPGTNGRIEETAYQIKAINDARLMIENKPHHGRENCICTGSTPEEIAKVIDATGRAFCLDIGHAICAANAVGEDINVYLERFLALSPRLYHLSDGDRHAVHDNHQHFGAGNYDLSRLLAMLRCDVPITIETNKDYPDSLADFVRDIGYLDDLCAAQPMPISEHIYGK